VLSKLRDLHSGLPKIFMHNLVFLFFSLLAQKDQDIGRGQRLPLKILLTSIVEYGN